ncbi:MAG: hypothetical protein Q7R71_02175 [bacterium]|nr:hypothetical protein [bacterium]
MPSYARLPAVILFVLFAVAVALGFVVAQHREKALVINDFDYSLFLQFNVRAFDPSLPPVGSINSFSSGNNMFFKKGPDGAPTIWRWVHTEPIKIIPAFLYTLTHSTLVSFDFYVILFFLPLLYGGFLLSKLPGHGWLIVAALASLAFYPSSFLYAAGELRAFFVLPSLFVCFFLSLLYRRPLAEKIIFLMLFLLVREEALVLSAAALVWEMLRNRRDAIPNKNVAILASIVAGWTALTLLYNWLMAYTFNPPVPGALLFPALFVCVCIALAVLWWLWHKGTSLWPFAPGAMFAIGALVPVTFSLITIEHLGSPLRIIYGRYGFMFFYVFVAVLVAYLYDHNKASLQKKIAVAGLAVCIMLFVISEAIPHASSTLQYVARWDSGAQDDMLVYRAAEAIPRDTPVLLDATTMVAFYLHQNTYAYNFLPYQLANLDEDAAFPANTAQLRKLISSGIQYTVLLNADADPLLKLIKETGKNTTLVEANSKFSFYRIK